MAYKNPNRNKEKFPWMGQRFIGTKKERKCFETKKEALLWESEQLPELAELKTHTVYLLDWATEYLRHAEQNYTGNTFDEKRRAFRQLFACPGINPKESANRLTALQVQKALQRESVSRAGNAANKDRKNLSAAWSWGAKFVDVPTENPFSRAGQIAPDSAETYLPTLSHHCKLFKLSDEHSA